MTSVRGRFADYIKGVQDTTIAALEQLDRDTSPRPCLPYERCASRGRSFAYVYQELPRFENRSPFERWR